MWRSAKKREGTSSPYIGVSWNKRARKWTAQIRLNGKNKNLGLYANELDARDRFRDVVAENHLEHLYANDVEEY